MTIITEAELPKFCFDVVNVSKRALTKPVDQKISISGISGSSGASGINGIHGYPGHEGSSYGGSGSSGGNGSNGSDAEAGQSGTDSQHALIRLNGTIENLNMQLKMFDTVHESSKHSSGIDWTFGRPIKDINYNFQLSKSKGIILLQAVGGNGGDAGQGGRGGDGGAGGNGGRGRPGTSGLNVCSESARGGDGGHGGAGGNGGSGGNGGNGGSGGNGGNAGAGGHVQILSEDPRLFVLIDVDCQAGIKGRRGHGGKGGCGGMGGSGGSGGIGGSGGNGGQNGLSGNPGMRGPDGMCGCNGQPGLDGYNGNDGRDASDGSIQYVVIDKDSNIIETNSDKYHASVICYTITDENNDGIYEPNSDFFISNVTWINNGAMILPSGSILSFPSTKYISNDINDISVLTSANINKVFLDSHQFKCHLNMTSPVPINQSYNERVKITSEITLLNRLFSGSVVSTTLTCHYPIQITNIEVPTFLGPNERTIVTVTFSNISTRPYGSCENSAGSIEFILYTHSSIKILPAKNDYLYEITSNSRGHYKINESISPQSTKSISFEIMMDANSVEQLYENLFWNINLLLRDTVIEQRRNNIRVVPTFQPNIHTDVLLVTNSRVGRAEFLAYHRLFQLFNYSSQTWDIERYGALHNSEIKWLNTTNLIIFIYSEPQSTFSAVQSQLFLQHMNSSENAGFISIGNSLPDEFDFALFDYNNLQYIDMKDRMKTEATNHLWSGFGFRQPYIEDIIVKANKIRSNYEKQDDHQFLYQIVYDDIIITPHSRCMTVVYGNKYVYKSSLNSKVGNRLIMIPSDNPLLTNSHLPFSLQTNQQDEVNNSSHEHKIDKIDLNSQFGRLICAILFYQGIEKSHRIISEKYELANCIFISQSNKFNFNQILASLAMSIIEREYNRESIEFPSSKRLVNEISNVIRKENNATNNFGSDQNDWLYLLIQSLYEYIDNTFWKSFPWCGCTNKAKQRHRLQEILNDLHSLSTVEILKNKRIYPEVRILRLQTLANLKFPATDYREYCVRPIIEIQDWKEEQKNSKTQFSSSVNSQKY